MYADKLEAMQKKEISGKINTSGNGASIIPSQSRREQCKCLAMDRYVISEYY